MLIRGLNYYSRTAERLLSGRHVSDLTAGEFSELLRSYNHIGATAAALHVSKIAIEKFPADFHLVESHHSICRSALTPEEFEREAMRCSSLRLGAPEYWSLAIAEDCMERAWGTDAEMLGEEPESWALLQRAALELAKPGLREYFDKHFSSGGLHRHTARPVSFESQFNGVFRFKQYSRTQDAT